MTDKPTPPSHAPTHSIMRLKKISVPITAMIITAKISMISNVNSIVKVCFFFSPNAKINIVVVRDNNLNIRGSNSFRTIQPKIKVR